ncbi:TetR/AcrR family transcriptional regulator [Schaalia sp. ZJ405]|uniref:TetR/AcrR family transcriptional regulator n=1 Tax=unclassified Schaalia TaxID=2691889 RepID=UPI0013EA0D72|nr:MULTISPECIES: TetR/AcrR family transcriptional regulator [unclassified Schaalia]QPK81060.1 TetR/AcrR family transcriptional regulator [Schaalia sp. ZJ405]
MEKRMGDQRSERGGYSVGKARREAILNAAMRLISDSGYHGFSLRDLGREVGVSHPAVIYHYPSKDALMLAVVKKFEDVLGLCDIEIDDEVPGGLRLVRLTMDTFEESVVKLMQFSKSPDASTVLNLQAMLYVEASNAEHPAHAYFVERMRVLQDFYKEKVDILKAQGAIERATQSDILARTIIHHWCGTVIEARFGKQGADARDTIAEFCALASYSLGITSDYLLGLSNSIPDDIVDVYARALRQSMGHKQ